MPLFRHSTKNFWIFLKKILYRVPRRGTRQRNFILFFWKIFAECLAHDTRQRSRELQKKFFLHSIVTDNIYIYIYNITNMHYISQAHAYLINPSQMHQSSTSQVYYYKFNIPTAATETAGVAPELRRRVDAISRRWHGSGIVWTRRQRLHKREEIACVRLKAGDWLHHKIPETSFFFLG